MEIRSLGYRTDLIFPRFEGIVTDRGGYLVIRTPANPGHYWGNFLLFAHPPGPDSLAEWTRLFHDEIGSLQPAGHLAFGWDSPEGERGAVEPFLAGGFRLEENAVLTAEALFPPPHCNTEIEIRPLSSNAEWAEAVDVHVAVSAEEFSGSGIRPFKALQLARYRRMAEAGRGVWMGAFLDGRMVAGLGVFTEGRLARFQQVGTHPDFRRRGICGTLVYESARYASSTLGAERLVMLADEHYHAGRIYEALGFRRAERQLGLELRPAEA